MPSLKSQDPARLSYIISSFLCPPRHILATSACFYLYPLHNQLSCNRWHPYLLSVRTNLGYHILQVTTSEVLRFPNDSTFLYSLSYLSMLFHIHLTIRKVLSLHVHSLHCSGPAAIHQYTLKLFYGILFILH